jgi:trehalose 6-phosphate phosphatase
VTLDDLAVTPHLLVALDFDGTLAPLVDEPMAARMLPAAAEAVRALVDAPETSVAFVSGRMLSDLRIIAEHDDASSIALAGSHGAQWWLPAAYEDDGGAEPDAAESALRDELRAAAEQEIADIPGAWIEPKTFGFGVHTRRVEGGRAPEAHDRVDAIMADRAPGWRRRVGHSITEYAFRDEGKDSAVRRLRALTGATGVLFAGDDLTDEDALRSLGPGDVGIRVGAGETAASMRVADESALAVVLLALAHRRTAARE